MGIHHEEETTMGFLDGLMKQALGGQGGAGGLGSMVSMVTQNPQILSALTGLLSTQDSSIGGSGGLAGLVSTFEKKGLGSMISSWISTGPNPPISPTQVKDVLGADTVGQFAAKAGVPAHEAGSLLAGLLPAVIDHLTPDGKMPATNVLETSLKSLLSGIGS
jgi:uncharacterized protein YidB (DUF937 family)